MNPLDQQNLGRGRVFPDPTGYAPSSEKLNESGSKMIQLRPDSPPSLNIGPHLKGVCVYFECDDHLRISQTLVYILVHWRQNRRPDKIHPRPEIRTERPGPILRSDT